MRKYIVVNACYIPLFKTKSCCLKRCFLTVQTLWQIDISNIVLLLKDLFDVSAVLLQNAFETTSPFTDASLRVYQVSNKHKTVLLFKQTVPGLCLHRCTPGVDFIQQTGFAQHLYKSFVRPHMEFAIQVWSPYLKRDIECLERVQRRAAKLVKEFRKLSYEDRLCKLKLTSLVNRRLRGDLIETYKTRTHQEMR